MATCITEGSRILFPTHYRPALATITHRMKTVSSFKIGRELLTVNSEGDPLLLEINCRHNGIHQYQMHNGGLFKEFSEEILDYYQSYQPRFVLRI